MDIKLLVMDVDGTLTDGKIYMSASGEIMKAFNIKDGYAITRLREYGIEPVIITGRKSEIVKRRCEELGIIELHQGISNKLFCLRTICNKRDITLSQVAYIGDDLNDLPCIQQCGLTGCPNDAIKSVLNKVTFISEFKGGEGAVRDFIKYILDRKTDSSKRINGNYDIQGLKSEEDSYTND